MFPILHRRFGEDGIIQGLFEMAGIPYVGENVAALSISMDKEKAKIVWELDTPPLYFQLSPCIDTVYFQRR